MKFGRANARRQNRKISVPARRPANACILRTLLAGDYCHHRGLRSCPGDGAGRGGHNGAGGRRRLSNCAYLSLQPCKSSIDIGGLFSPVSRAIITVTGVFPSRTAPALSARFIRKCHRGHRGSVFGKVGYCHRVPYITRHEGIKR